MEQTRTDGKRADTEQGTASLDEALRSIPAGWAVWRIEQCDLTPGDKTPAPLPLWTVTLRSGQPYRVVKSTGATAAIAMIEAVALSRP